MAVTEQDLTQTWSWVHTCGQSFWWKDREGLIVMAERHQRECGHQPDWWLDY